MIQTIETDRAERCEVQRFRAAELQISVCALGTTEQN
jgi:hypothetical protein